ncbi:hypothetical protein WI25_01400 [Burkholderia cepacia]|uniref:hypothetical protein n=1 Tax=Burkholderia cepacia TaxID=292 RepID=UPI0007532140|nr:hypothetical protein [Burkholderia cepacia]KUY74557.1 hypothetical protein WI25_01400 [Burkholderia cepacia]
MQTIKAEDIKGGCSIAVSGSNYRVQSVVHGEFEILVHTTQRVWGEAFDTVSFSFNRGDSVQLTEQSQPQNAQLVKQARELANRFESMSDTYAASDDRFDAMKLLRALAEIVEKAA